MIDSTASPVLDGHAIVAAKRKALRPSVETTHITVLVPVYDEADAINLFLARIYPILDSEGGTYTITFINDGSRDNTLGILLRASQLNPNISVINLTRNFGKEAALTAGLDQCDADAVIVMDVDLQDPPELIKPFVKNWRDGYDIVYGKRTARRTDSFLKRWTAKKFYTFFNSISNVEIPDNVGDFRLIDRRVVDAMGALKERNRFMKGLFAWVGYPAIAVPYERPQREAGKTKFGFGRLWNFALDGIFGFSTIPLKAWTYFGVLVAMGAIIYAAIVFVQTLMFGIDVPGYASLTIFILGLSSAQLISLGIIGEYLARLTLESKQRPNYLIEHHYKDDAS